MVGKVTDDIMVLLSTDGNILTDFLPATTDIKFCP